MVYNYTKPRGPIAADFNSPGPCYGLPSLVGQHGHDPRSVHSRGPAYPFGGGNRSMTSAGSIGCPGPASYLPDPKVQRTGRVGTPAFSLIGRHDTGSMSNATPGPGAYSPERAGPTARRSTTPAYSFGGRHQRRSLAETPAPNQYLVPSMLCRTVDSAKRQAPAYSLYGRPSTGGFHEDLHRTPGPGSYLVTDPSTYKARQPMYSLVGRNNGLTEDGKKPGPGAHSPEQSWVHKQSSPSYSFGIRHSEHVAPIVRVCSDAD